MTRCIAISVLGCLLLWPLAAWPCGGGFGDGLHIDPSQKIVLAHRNGVETYIFSPHFCGAAAQFGLILPVPDKLATSPTLAEAKLFEQLEVLSAPKIVTETICEDSRGGFGDAGMAGGGRDASNGVDVVDRGQVGIFDWVLLKADTAASFTDWLSANAFPYDAGASAHFAHYVQAGWYFVAFKITADSKAPPAGSQLCGDLGPIQLSFPAEQLVIPARIAAVDTTSSWSFGWRVFAIAAQQVGSTEFSTTLRFSGAIGAAELASYSELAKLASAGDRLTKLDIQFYSSSVDKDITLTATPTADFRQTITQYRYVPCDGGVVVADSGMPVVTDAGVPVRRDASVVGPAANDDSGGCAIGGADLSSALALLLLGLAGCARRIRDRARR